jgi:hypothetical protein
MLLRFTYEDVEGTWPKDQDIMQQNSSIRKVTWVDDEIRVDDEIQKKATWIESSMDE